MTTNNTKTVEYNVQGMHCASCEFFLMKKLSEIDGVYKVDAKTNSSKVILTIDQNASLEDLHQKFDDVLKDSDYKIVHPQTTLELTKHPKELGIGFIIAAIFLSIFFSLQYFGYVRVPEFSEINLTSVFIIGVIASISSCMAVVGGLALSMSAMYTKTFGEKYALTSMIVFHISRIIGFLLLGIIIGYLGSFLNLNSSVERVIDSILAVVMILIGINMLGLSSKISSLQFRFPKKFAHYVNHQSESTKIYAPVLFGILTFFMPCGFTQSMQFYSMTLGDPIQSGLTLFVFALGTFPALALATFLGGRILKNKSLQYTLGFIVIIFSLNLLLGLI